MAISLVGTGSLAYTTATTTRVMTTPAATAVGDVFHIQLTSRVDSTVTGLSGAQLLLQMTQSGSSYGSVLLWTATTAGAQSVTFTLSAAGAGSVTWARYSGVDSTDPVLADLQHTVASADQWSTPTLNLSENGYVVGGMSIPSGSRIVTPITAGWTALVQGQERAGALFEYGAHMAGTVAAGDFVVDPSNFMTTMTYVFALRHADGGGGDPDPPGPGEPAGRGEAHLLEGVSTSWLIEANGSTADDRWMKPVNKALWQAGTSWDGIIPISSGQGHRFVTGLGDTDLVGPLVDARNSVRATIAFNGSKLAVYRTNDSTPRVSTYSFASGVYTPLVTDATGPLSTLNHDDSPVALAFTPNGHLWAARYQGSLVQVSKSTDDGATWSAPATAIPAMSEPTGMVTLAAVGTNLVLLASANGSGQVLARRIAQGASSLGSGWTTMDPPSVSPASADDHISSLVIGSSLYVAAKTSNPSSAQPLIYVARWSGGVWSTFTVIPGPDAGERPSRPSLASDGTNLWVIYGHINASRLACRTAALSDLSAWSSEDVLIPSGDFSDGAITPTAVAPVPMVLAHDRSTNSIYSLLLPEAGVPSGGGGTGVAVLELSWAGIPQGGSFSATCKSDQATAVRLVVASNQALTTGRVLSANVVPDANDWARATVSGLGNGTWYYGWELSGGGTLATAAQGSFVIGASSFRFAFGSCLDSMNTSNAFTRIAARDPDMFFHLGDFHYEDNTSTVQNDHLNDIEMQLDNNSGLRNLIASTPTIYLKSDHDAGGGNNALPGSYTGPNRGAYKQAVPHPDLVDPNGLYYAFVIGRVRFIVTDSRYLRTTTQMLGTAQMNWLLSQFTQPEPVKIWVQDSTFITNEAPEGEDKWSDYDNDRTIIGNYVNANADDIGQLITIHGDQHALAADDGSSNSWGGFPTFAAAPFGQSSSHKSFSWSEGIYPTSPSSTVVRQYGIVDVTDLGGSTITISFTGYDTFDASRITHTVVASTVPGDPGDPGGGGGTSTPWGIFAGGQITDVELLGRYVNGSVVPGEAWIH